MVSPKTILLPAADFWPVRKLRKDILFCLTSESGFFCLPWIGVKDMPFSGT